MTTLPIAIIAVLIAVSVAAHALADTARRHRTRRVHGRVIDTRTINGEAI
ncbi:hypothetical protein [Breoghania sp.]|nr:hypothetical protein [Breoghania sp.]